MPSTIDPTVDEVPSNNAFFQEQTCSGNQSMTRPSTTIAWRTVAPLPKETEAFRKGPEQMHFFMFGGVAPVEGNLEMS